MSRKLKFRVWNGVEWLGVDEFTLWDLEHPHKGYTFQQFTGMLDKNGKEIYEGDLVRVTSEEYINENFVATVIYDEASYHFKVNDGDIKGCWSGDDVEVIGNIFENKDLICDHTKYHMSVNGNCYNCGKLIFPKK